MYLFTRSTKLSSGHLREGAEWAAHITEKVNQVTSLNVGLWSSVFSPGVGSISWGATVESLTELEDANAKLMVDDIFVEMANRGATFTNGQLDDRVAQFVHQPAELIAEPKYVTVVESALANGSFESGVVAGIEIAQKATELGMLPTAFLIGTTGAYGSVAWLTSSDTLERLEASEQTVNANPDFIKLVDKYSTRYLPGVTTQTIWQRII